MARSHESHERLAALNGAGHAARPVPAPAPAPGGEATGGSPPDGPETPDPRFWGPEPHAVRRGRREVADPTRTRRRGRTDPWWRSLVERARDARLEVGVGVLVVVLVAAAAGVVWYRMGVAGGGAPERPGAARTVATGGTRAGGAPSAAPSRPPVTARAGGAGASTRGSRTTTPVRGGDAVVVHVAGAVTTPGVLLMPAGARVIDAVEGAGGALADADLDRLNLAAKVADGQRILVLKVGAAVAAGATGSSGAPGLPGDPGLPIDLNAATGAQLEALPGIGPALAGAILAERDRRGGFRSVNELREVRGIGEARFADLRDRVTV